MVANAFGRYVSTGSRSGKTSLLLHEPDGDMTDSNVHFVVYDTSP